MSADLFDNFSDIDNKEDEFCSQNNEDFNGSFGPIPVIQSDESDEQIVDEIKTNEEHQGKNEEKFNFEQDDDIFEEDFFNPKSSDFIQGASNYNVAAVEPVTLKKDFAHEPQLLFECLYCLKSAKKLLETKFLTMRWFKNCLEAANNEQIPVTLPSDINRQIKVTSAEVEQYFEQKGFPKQRQQVELEFQQASLALFGLNRAVAPREVKSQAELAIAKVQIKGNLENPPALVLGHLTVPSILGKLEYKSAYLYEKIRTDILHLPQAYFVQGCQVVQDEKKQEEMISSASEESFQGKVSLQRWALSQKQRKLANISLESNYHDIYKPQFSSEETDRVNSLNGSSYSEPSFSSKFKRKRRKSKSSSDTDIYSSNSSSSDSPKQEQFEEPNNCHQQNSNNDHDFSRESKKQMRSPRFLDENNISLIEPDQDNRTAILLDSFNQGTSDDKSSPQRPDLASSSDLSVADEHERDNQAKLIGQSFPNKMPSYSNEVEIQKGWKQCDQIEIDDQARRPAVTAHHITDIALVSAGSSTDQSMAHILLGQQHFNMSPDYDHEPVKKHKTITNSYFHEDCSEDQVLFKSKPGVWDQIHKPNNDNKALNSERAHLREEGISPQLVQSTTLLAKRVVQNDGEYKIQRQQFRNSMEDTAEFTGVNSSKPTPSRATTRANILANATKDLLSISSLSKQHQSYVTNWKKQKKQVPYQGKMQSKANSSKFTVGQQRIRRQQQNLKTNTTEVYERKVHNNSSGGRHGMILNAQQAVNQASSITSGEAMFVPAQHKLSFNLELHQQQQQKFFDYNINLQKRPDSSSAMPVEPNSGGQFRMAKAAEKMQMSQQKGHGGMTIRKVKHRYLVDKSGRIANLKSQEGNGSKTSRRRPPKDFEKSPVLCQSVELIPESQIMQASAFGNSALQISSMNVPDAQTQNSAIFNNLSQSNMIENVVQRSSVRTALALKRKLPPKKNLRTATAERAIPQRTPRQKPIDQQLSAFSAIYSTSNQKKAPSLMPVSAQGPVRKISKQQRLIEDSDNQSLGKITLNPNQLSPPALPKKLNSKKLDNTPFGSHATSFMIGPQNEEKTPSRDYVQQQAKVSTTDNPSCTSPIGGGPVNRARYTRIIGKRVEIKSKKSTSPIQQTRQGVPIKTNHSSQPSMGLAARNGLSFSVKNKKPLETKIQAGVRYPGSFAAQFQPNSAPGRSEQEQQRPGGVLVGSDEDDMAELMFLDSAVGAQNIEKKDSSQLVFTEMGAFESGNFSRGQTLNSQRGDISKKIDSGKQSFRKKRVKATATTVDLFSSNDTTRNHQAAGRLNTQTVKSSNKNITKHLENKGLDAFKQKVTRLAQKVEEMQQSDIKQPMFLIKSGYQKLQDSKTSLFPKTQKAAQQSFEHQRSVSNGRVTEQKFSTKQHHISYREARPQIYGSGSRLTRGKMRQNQKYYSASSLDLNSCSKERDTSARKMNEKRINSMQNFQNQQRDTSNPRSSPFISTSSNHAAIRTKQQSINSKQIPPKSSFPSKNAIKSFYELGTQKGDSQIPQEGKVVMPINQPTQASNGQVSQNTSQLLRGQILASSSPRLDKPYRKASQQDKRGSFLQVSPQKPLSGSGIPVKEHFRGCSNTVHKLTSAQPIMVSQASFKPTDTTGLQTNAQVRRSAVTRKIHKPSF